jgi:ATP-dependent Clp protease ATP-binding subunit ClpA
MARLIQDTIRRALADELLFGRLVSGGKVTVTLLAITGTLAVTLWLLFSIWWSLR